MATKRSTEKKDTVPPADVASVEDAKDEPGVFAEPATNPTEDAPTLRTKKATRENAQRIGSGKIFRQGAVNPPRT